GGDPRVLDDYHLLPTAPHDMAVKAPRGGYVRAVDAELIGRATMVLGAGRDRVEQAVDHAVGATLLRTRGDPVKQGEPLLELHYREADRLEHAMRLVERAYEIGGLPPAPSSV